MKIIDTNKLNRFWTNGVKPVVQEVEKKLNISRVINNLLTTEAGFALDARQGKVLQDQVDEINSNLLGSTIIARYISQGTGATEYEYVATRKCELYYSFKIPVGVVSASVTVNGIPIISMGYAWENNNAPFIIPFSCQLNKGDKAKFANGGGASVNIELQMLVIRS